MFQGVLRREPLLWVTALTIASVLASGCDTVATSQTPLPPPGSKPVVTINAPANGKAAVLNEAVTVDAVATDRSGILRVDFLVNDASVDSQTLFVASPRFQYQAVWRPASVGQNKLTIVAYNVNNVASDPVSIAVTVAGPSPTATGPHGTPTSTPFVIYVTATPLPTARPGITPIVTVVTATPRAAAPPTGTQAPP